MQIYEYQIKKIFDEAGIPILQGAVAYTAKEAFEIAQKMNINPHSINNFVVKAQVPSYLRKKGTFIEYDKCQSGLQKASSPRQVQKQAEMMLLKHLRTPVSNGRAFEVKKVYIEEFKEAIMRFLVSMKIDFEKQKAILTLKNISQDGSIHKPIIHDLKIQKEKLSLISLKRLVLKLNLTKNLQKQLIKIIQALYKVFLSYKAFEVNIDPLILTRDNEFYVMSGKIDFDPDVVAQNKELAKLIDHEEETVNETRARLNNCRYTKLSGNIGCIINGSGLSMATQDLICQNGGQPACLFDIGTEPTKDIVSNALKAVLSEPDVEGVLINIFGGSARCDTIAEGLILAAQEISVGIPLVVRIDGTNEQIASRMLFESGLPFKIVKEMSEAVELIIHSVQEIM